MIAALIAHTIGRIGCWLTGVHQPDWYRVQALGAPKRCERCRRQM